jgi:hypothetical protein
MSKGPGAIERRIAELLVTTRDRALSVEDIARHAFNLQQRAPRRAHRLSATRAAHRLLRRVAETQDTVETAFQAAMAEAEAVLGRPPRNRGVMWSIGERWIGVDEKFAQAMRASLPWPAFLAAYPLMQRAEDLGGTGFAKGEEIRRMGPWRETQTRDRRLWFHPRDYPVRVWAVSIQPAGVVWADAEITGITQRNVMVRYAGVLARLDRDNLQHWWAWWRGVMFVSSRTGRIAARLDQMWWERYGKTAFADLPPFMQFPLADAMALLGVPVDYTYEDVVAAFRREAKKVHPDIGGTAEQFRRLVEARDRLLAALGTTAPKPKTPTYAPTGAQLVYRVVRQPSARRLPGSSRRLLPA